MGAPEPPPDRHCRQLLNVLRLPGGFPEVMVVIARHVVDDRVEDGRVAAEGQAGEPAEDGGGDLVWGERQVEDVACEDEGGKPLLMLCEPADTREAVP